MRGYLLDTNVLSEIVKKRPSAQVMGRLRDARQDALFISVVSVMEMRFGAVRSPAGAPLWDRIRKEILARVRILPFGADEAARAGEILADLATRGVPVGIEDVMIGATALVGDLVAVTRNMRHLGRIEGLTVEDWWAIRG